MTITQQILHQFRSDLKFARWGLIGLTLMLAIYVVSATAHFNDIENRSEISNILFICATATASFLIIMVIMKDAPLTTRAFWGPRPLRGQPMASAKILSLFVISALILIAYLLPPTLTGATSLSLAMAATCLETVLPFLFAASALALISSSISRFFLNTIAILISFFLVSALIENIFEYQLAFKDWEVKQSAFATATLFGLFAALMLFYLQYRHRSPMIGIVFFAMTLLLCYLIKLFFPYNWNTPHLSEKSAATLGFDQVTLSMNLNNKETITQTAGGYNTGNHEWREITYRAPGNFHSIPEGYSIGDIYFDGEAIYKNENGEKQTISFRRPEWTLVPNFNIQDHFPGFEKIAPNQNPSQESHLGALSFTSAEFVQIKESLMHQIGDTPITYTGEVSLELIKHELAALIPLKDIGSTVTVGDNGWIAKFSGQIDPQPSQTLTWGNIELRIKGWNTWRYRSPIKTNRHLVFLVNQKSKQYFQLRNRSGGSSSSGRVYVINQEMDLLPYLGREDLKKIIDKTWLEDAEIALFFEHSQGRIKRPFNYEDITLPASN